MKRLFRILRNPYVLPVLPAVAVMFLLPVNFQRCFFEVTGHQALPQGVYHWYEDLTNDGYSERVVVGDRETYVYAKVYDHRGVLYNRWNMRGSIDHISAVNALPITGDYNDSGQQEIFIFTLVNDSIFLHMIGDLEETSMPVRDRFIATVGPGRGRPDPRIYPGEMVDITGDSFKELVFAVKGGFSITPRRVYAYSIANDSLMQSPEAYYAIRGIRQQDITGDGKREILIDGFSAANLSPSMHRYHDNSNWVMVLDGNLDFLFAPVNIPGKAKKMELYSYNEDEEAIIVAVVYRYNQNKPVNLRFYSPEGKKLREMEIPVIARQGYLMPYGSSFRMVLYEQGEGVYLYDGSQDRLQFLFDAPWSSRVIRKDLTGDGNREFIVPDIRNGRMYIYAHDLGNYDKVCMDFAAGRISGVSFISNPHDDPQVSIQIENHVYTLGYRRNPVYFLGYLYFAGIYAGFLLFGLLTRHLQTNQLRKKEAIENKITGLQLNMVKNQLNPHFSFNAINAAIHAISNKEAEKAAYYLRRFSRMHRLLVATAESMNRSLRDEITFACDYLELEKMRFDNAFGSELYVAPGVNTDIRVPKMIIQTYVENALKHGLSKRKSGGRVSVFVTQDKRGVYISITDNGVGRDVASASNTGSTGRGQQIMQEYFDLYYKYYRTKIQQDIRDLYDKEGNPVGTRVRVSIFFSHDTKRERPA